MARKPGKYSHVLNGLKKVPSETGNDKFDAVVKMARSQMRMKHDKECRTPEFIANCPCGARPKTVIELAAQWRDLRKEEEKLEALMTELNVKLEAAKQLVVDAYDEEGYDSLRLADDASGVDKYPEPHAIVKDKILFNEYCLADPDLRKGMMLMWQTTNKLSNERLLAGEEPLPGVEVMIKDKLVWRK